MTNILKPGDYGYGMLIEHDAGYVNRHDNQHILNENFNPKENEPILINCVLQKWGVQNKNGRIYPKDVLTNQIEEFQKLIDINSGLGEADHPDSSIISLLNISHLITKMWWGRGDDENVLYGQIKLIVSPGYLKYGIVSVIGDKILLYLQNKIKLGISSRGVGSLKEVNGENLVQDDFELIGFDLVATPSTPGAYLIPEDKDIYITEEKTRNKVFIKENKIIKSINTFLN